MINYLSMDEQRADDLSKNERWSYRILIRMGAGDNVQ